MPKTTWTRQEFDELWGHAIKVIQKTVKVLETDEPVAPFMDAYMIAAINAGMKVTPAAANGMNAPMKETLIVTIKGFLKKHNLMDAIAFNSVSDEQLIKIWNDCGGAEMVFISRIRAETTGQSDANEGDGKDQDELAF